MAWIIFVQYCSPLTFLCHSERKKLTDQLGGVMQKMPLSYWAEIDEEVIGITMHQKVLADSFSKELTLSQSALESPSKVAKTVVLYLKQWCVSSTTMCCVLDWGWNMDLPEFSVLKFPWMDLVNGEAGLGGFSTSLEGWMEAIGVRQDRFKKEREMVTFMFIVTPCDLIWWKLQSPHRWLVSDESVTSHGEL